MDCRDYVWASASSAKSWNDSLNTANKYLGYNRISEDLAIAALKSDTHYRNIAHMMNEDRTHYEAEIGSLPGFKVYRSVANFIPYQIPT